MDKLKAIFRFFQETQQDWIRTQPARMAAALAFRGILSLAPMLLIVMIIVAIIFDRHTAQTTVIQLLEPLLGPEITAVTQEMLSSTAAMVSHERLIPLFISLGIMIYAATALFYELKLTLNTIWGIPYVNSVGVFNFIKDRLLALATVLAIGFLFVAVILINAIISLLVNFFRLDALFHLASLAASFGVVVLLIALIFKYLPDAAVAWRDVWIGAAVTSVLMMVGVWGLSIYLALSSLGAGYGGAGTLTATLVWLYYSAHIFIVGAAFTRSFALRVGSKPPPTPATPAAEAEAQ